MGSLGINLSQIIFQLINFIILLVVLKKFLYKPVMDYVDKLKKQEEDFHKITQEIQNQKTFLEQSGEQQKTELKKVYNDTIEKARKEAHTLVDEAKENAKTEGRRILEEYNTEAVQSRDSLMAGAKKDIYEYAVKISEMVLTSSLTDEQKDKLMKLAMEKLNDEQK